MSLTPIGASSSGNLPSAAQSETKVRSKDAEHILCRGLGRRLVRQTSAHQLNRGEEAFKPASKSSALWDCVDRRPNKLGGYIDIFQIKPEFNEMEFADAVELNEKTGNYKVIDGERGKLFEARMNAAVNETVKQFPAIEPHAWIVWKKQLASRRSPDDLWNQLGICCRKQDDGFYIEIPDHAALLANWDAFRKNRPEPLAQDVLLAEAQRGRQHPQQFSTPLDVVSSDGIASDSEYFFSLLVRMGLYSNGPEAIHDFFLHLFPLFESIIMMEGYGKVIKYKLPFNKIVGDPSYVLSKGFNFSKFQHTKALLSIYRRVMIVERVIQDESLNISKESVLQFKLNMDKIKANLGVVADKAYAKEMMAFDCDDEMNQDRFFALSYQMQMSFNSSWSTDVWRVYLRTKRPELGTFDFSLLQRLEAEMYRIESEFDQTRTKWHPAASFPAGPSSSSS